MYFIRYNKNFKVLSLIKVSSLVFLFYYNNSSLHVHDFNSLTATIFIPGKLSRQVMQVGTFLCPGDLRKVSILEWTEVWWNRGKCDWSSIVLEPGYVLLAHFPSWHWWFDMVHSLYTLVSFANLWLLLAVWHVLQSGHSLFFSFIT